MPSEGLGCEVGFGVPGGDVGFDTSSEPGQCRSLESQISKSRIPWCLRLASGAQRGFVYDFLLCFPCSSSSAAGLTWVNSLGSASTRTPSSHVLQYLHRVLWLPASCSHHASSSCSCSLLAGSRRNPALAWPSLAFPARVAFPSFSAEAHPPRCKHPCWPRVAATGVPMAWQKGLLDPGTLQPPPE